MFAHHHIEIHTHTHTHTLRMCVCVYVSLYGVVQCSCCCCFRVCFYIIWEYFNSVCCVCASRLVRERHMHARHSSVHSLSRSNVRDREIERDARSGLCVRARTHTQALLVMITL